MKTQAQLEALRAIVNSLTDKEVGAVVLAAAEAFTDDISRNEISKEAGLGKNQRAELWVKLRDAARG